MNDSNDTQHLSDNGWKQIIHNSPTWIGIVDYVSSIRWVYEKVFGRLLDYLVFDQSYEAKKDILDKVYWFNDVESIFTKKIERKEFKEVTQIIFKSYLQQQQNVTNNWK